MHDSLLSCREREEDEREFFFQRKFWHSQRGHLLSDSYSKEYVVCQFQIRMQIQIQNVSLGTNSNSKNTGNLQKGTPKDFCSVNQVAHFL
jgi:hypothetical protein